MQSLKTSIEVLWRLILCFTWQRFDISRVTPTHLNSRGYITLRPFKYYLDQFNIEC